MAPESSGCRRMVHDARVCGNAQVLDVMHTSAVAARSRDPVFDIFFSCVAPVLAESEALVQLVMLDGSFQPPAEIGVVNIDIAELLRTGADERPVWQGWYPLCPPSSLSVHVQRRPGTWSTARPVSLVSGDDGGTCEVQLSIQVCRAPPCPPTSSLLLASVSLYCLLLLSALCLPAVPSLPALCVRVLTAEHSGEPLPRGPASPQREVRGGERRLEGE
jgi:hypothetical protein